MGITINIGGPSNEVSGGNMSFSRQGVYSYVFVYGARNRIETTLFELPTGDYIDNVTLEKNWDTAVDWDIAAAKSEVTKYQDHYRRYSVQPLDDNLAAIDPGKGATGSEKTPRGYRDFESVLTRLETDETELSINSSVNKGESWLRAADKGINVTIDNEGNAPSILFNAKDNTKNITKDLYKSVTLTMVGIPRLFNDGFVEGSNIETDFIPFLVVQKDRFRSTETRLSYRDNPTETATDGTGIDNSTEIAQYSTNQSETFGRLATSGDVLLTGNAEVYNGDTVTTLNIYYNGAYVAKTVELLVVSRVYDFTTDTTSIVLGRP